VCSPPAAFEVIFEGKRFAGVSYPNPYQSVPLTDGLIDWALSRAGKVHVDRVIKIGTWGDCSIYHVTVKSPDGSTHKHAVRANGMEVTRSSA